jgi:curved DNA-binding protein CbpA
MSNSSKNISDDDIKCRTNVYLPKDIKDALKVLGYKTEELPTSVQELNKRFHILALKHHPDKIGHTGDDELFKQINRAHKLVKDYTFADTADAGFKENSDYSSIFGIFVKSLLFKLAKKPIHPEQNEVNVNAIIQTIISKGIQSAVILFRSMNKHSCVAIYEILSENQELFSISREILDELNAIVESKMKNDTIINLNPTILDMLLDKVYILRENGHSYYIPLWHSQLHFKLKNTAGCGSGGGGGGGSDTETTDTEAAEPAKAGDASEASDAETASEEAEMIILCNPELPPHITIDEDNNIFINNVDIDIYELFYNQVIHITIDDETKAQGFIYELYAGDVCFQTKTKQCVRLYGSNGISRVSNSDIYNASNKSNVYAVFRLIAKMPATVIV